MQACSASKKGQNVHPFNPTSLVPRPFLPSHPWPYPQPTMTPFPLLSLNHPTHRPCAPENSSLPQGLLQHSFEQGHVSKVFVLGCLPRWHHTYHFFMQGLLDLGAL